MRECRSSEGHKGDDEGGWLHFWDEQCEVEVGKNLKVVYQNCICFFCMDYIPRELFSVENPVVEGSSSV